MRPPSFRKRWPDRRHPRPRRGRDPTPGREENGPRRGTDMRKNLPALGGPKRKRGKESPSLALRAKFVHGPGKVVGLEVSRVPRLKQPWHTGNEHFPSGVELFSSVLVRGS